MTIKKRRYAILLIAVFLIPSFAVVGSYNQSNTVSRMKTSQSFDSHQYAESRAISKVLEAMDMEWETPIYEPSWPVAHEGREAPGRIIQPIDESMSLNNTDSQILYDAFAKENAQRQKNSPAVRPNDVSALEGSMLEAIYYPIATTKDYPQPPQTPAKEGHWFQKLSYSVLAFQFTYPSGFNTLDLWMDIERDQDSYSRYLTVYFDGSLAYRTTISSSGFHSSIAIWWVSAGTHKIEVEINYCGWKDHQWKMTYIQPFISRWPGASEPIQDFWEYFPDDRNPSLEYQVLGGRSTYVNLLVEHLGSSPSRQVQVYYKSSATSSWVLRSTIWTGSASKIYLGYWSSICTIYVKLSILDSSVDYYGYKISYNSANYRAVNIEIDYMEDTTPNQGNPIMDTDDIEDMV
ncbi:MAG: hypothetical protein P1Q69_06415, partial [Candidatus Thorarchaeota archaeon]|nr:hypothetical protein [Candidatus Thorarchaeota archaeon]